jgi:acetylornithine/N-succinyldiaminopimelate aminotransferase
VKAVQEQVAKLIHVPNTWYTEPQGEWAKLLAERSFGGQAFFCNSGTEANEAAIKLVRLRTDGRSTRSSPSRAASTAAPWGA